MIDVKDKSVEELINENLNLVRYTMKQYFNTTYDEDLYQVGCVGLVKAANIFDPNRNVKFSSFAIGVIKNEYLQLFRKTSRRNKYMYISLEEPTTENLTILDILPDENDYFVEIDIKQICQKVFDEFSPDKKQIIESYLIIKDQYMIAKKLGVSQPQVSRIVKKFRNRVREELYKEI